MLLDIYSWVVGKYFEIFSGVHRRVYLSTWHLDKYFCPNYVPYKFKWLIFKNKRACFNVVPIKNKIVQLIKVSTDKLKYKLINIIYTYNLDEAWKYIVFFFFTKCI